MTKQEKIKRINEYKAQAQTAVQKDMIALGIYREEFDKIIEMYAEMKAQYDLAWEEFVASGCKAECQTKTGGTRKTAAVTTMEELRRQIGAYADRLCITPKSQNVEEKKVGSKLEEVLAQVGKL